jgi:hypothetical protein
MDILYYNKASGVFDLVELVLQNQGQTNGLTVTGLNGVSWQLAGFKSSTQDVTASLSLLMSDSGKTYSGPTQTGGRVLTLPSASQPGLTFSFINPNGFQNLRIDPQASESIIYSGGTMAAGEYIELVDAGSALILVSNDTNDWVAIYENGTLVEEVP